MATSTIAVVLLAPRLAEARSHGFQQEDLEFLASDGLPVGLEHLVCGRLTQLLGVLRSPSICWATRCANTSRQAYAKLAISARNLSPRLPPVGNRDGSAKTSDAVRSRSRSSRNSEARIPLRIRARGCEQASSRRGAAKWCPRRHDCIIAEHVSKHALREGRSVPPPASAQEAAVCGRSGRRNLGSAILAEERERGGAMLKKVR